MRTPWRLLLLFFSVCMDAGPMSANQGLCRLRGLAGQGLGHDQEEVVADAIFRNVIFY